MATRSFAGTVNAPDFPERAVSHNPPPPPDLPGAERCVAAQ